MKGERVTLECKLAKAEVPKSVWDTYSAFANTIGGIILLGVEEHKKEADPAKRFEIVGTGSNTNHWEEAYRLLPDEFTREDLQRTCNVIGKSTPIKNVVYNWRLLGCIEITETVTAPNGKQKAVRFRKR